MASEVERKQRQKRFDRLMRKAAEYQVGTYSRKFVAPVFQLMIRAEAGAYVGDVQYVSEGELHTTRTTLAECVCVTCGKRQLWKGGQVAPGGGMHCGHFLASRQNAVLFDEDNVAPQCAYCNLYLSGNQEAFSVWMAAVRGPAVIEKLHKLRNGPAVSFSREQLVSMRLDFADRLKAAEKAMQ